VKSHVKVLLVGVRASGDARIIGDAAATTTNKQQFYRIIIDLWLLLEPKLTAFGSAYFWKVLEGQIIKVMFSFRV
jgi:hypothetical protein